ncbi:MAG: metal/formaldehyde-sensitive transcriptional repressor [Planctomycetes bacterium]|jgi:DNA-binding FrmR family transcriptional regulator|nr:metal/formaldehyde-sensitive transcriptional repressor [Planctomycetota bacterium]
MHIRSDSKALLARVARLEGQIRGLRATIERGEDSDCYAVMQQLAAARGALDGLIRLFIEGHIREHVVGAGDPARERAGEELIQTLRSFLK